MSDKLTYKVWVQVSVERCNLADDEYKDVVKWEPIDVGIFDTRLEAKKYGQDFCNSIDERPTDITEEWASI